MDEQVRILCVDDERNVLKALTRLYIDDEFELLTATSGEEGIAILEEISPVQLVISDYRMPGMNGVDFLKEVCEKWPETVRIVLSGYADMASIVSAINEGQIYKFIPKPWNDDELKVTVANAIERYNLHRENVKLTEELKQKNEELIGLNNNLEKLVEERTSELLFQNRVLTRSQNILDSLPVGVVGIDPDGLIVQCNKRAIELFGGADGNLVGNDREDILTEEINAFVDEVNGAGAIERKLPMGNQDFRAKGILMEYPDNQNGVILVFDCDKSGE